MRKRYAVVAAIVILALIGAAYASSVVRDATEETCPDGQELVSVQAGDLSLHNKSLPPGAHFEDRFGKTTVRSDSDSATANVPLTIECR